MISIIKRIIADFHQNPIPSFRYRALDVPLNINKIITIIGPRRAGKTYLYDNGFANALNASFAEDRGKLLENLVFRHLREQTEDIFSHERVGNVILLFFLKAKIHSLFKCHGS